MTNEIKTHRLIVSMPNTSGEEADTYAESIEQFARGFESEETSDIEVTHALGESLPARLHVLPQKNGDVFVEDWVNGEGITLQGPLELRQLAGVLLARAAELEPSELCPTCGQPDNCGDCTHEDAGVEL